MSHATVLVAVDGPLEKVEEQVAWQMKPFDENGTMFRHGSRWDWYVIGGRADGWLADGNIIQVKAVNLEALRERQLAEFTKNYQDCQNDTKCEENIRELCYGVKAGETLESYLQRRITHPFPAHYAFLRGRHWHENERLGWWGCTAKTECEVGGKEIIGKCLVKDPRNRFQIVVWKSDAETWERKFYDRFVAPLPPEMFLVTVDYHV